jgi:hypothetical protein
MPTNTWTYTLDLSDFYGNEHMSIANKAGRVASRIESSRFFTEEWTSQIDDVVNDLRDFSDGGTSLAEFDDIMRELYSYADMFRVWVKTREGI